MIVKIIIFAFIKKVYGFARAKMINDNYWSNDPLCPKDAAYYRFS